MKRITFILMLIFGLFALNSCELIWGGGTNIPTTESTTVVPTVTPTNGPTMAPTVTPTVELTNSPTMAPTVTPTVEPTNSPTIVPTKTPTVVPTTSINVPSTMNLSIIEMNDIHGYITQNDNGAYGLSNAAYKINQIRNEDSYDNTVLIANGDMFQGTGLVKMSYGRVLVESMNQMGFDVCGVGNHEFDWGLDKITQYFDGNKGNGEANFPLLNTNIKLSSTNKLLLDQNILSSTILNKNGLKVGIMSLIGDVYGSICYNMVKDYTFDTNYSSIVASEGAKLKEAGADIIIVNVHDGNSKGVTSFSPNKTIANLKYNGEYLVDAVINGHTHTRQYGTITRTGGVAMPVIQSSGNLATFGRINLTVDMKTKKVTSTSTEHIYPSNTTYDKNVEYVINDYYNQSKAELEEVYCQNVNLDRYDENLQTWVCNVANKALNTDVFICNTGGLRSSVDAGELDFNDVYQLNPFDNRIIIVSLTGSKIKQFINNNSSYYFTYTKTGDISTLNDSKTYKLGIIDYVYFSTYFENYQQTTYVDTEIILRDLMIQDLRLRTGTFNPAVDNSAKISQIYFG